MCVRRASCPLDTSLVQFLGRQSRPPTVVSSNGRQRGWRASSASSRRAGAASRRDNCGSEDCGCGRGSECAEGERANQHRGTRDKWRQATRLSGSSAAANPSVVSSQSICTADAAGPACCWTSAETRRSLAAPFPALWIPTGRTADSCNATRSQWPSYRFRANTSSTTAIGIAAHNEPAGGAYRPPESLSHLVGFAHFHVTALGGDRVSQPCWAPATFCKSSYESVWTFYTFAIPTVWCIRATFLVCLFVVAECRARAAEIAAKLKGTLPIQFGDSQHIWTCVPARNGAASRGVCEHGRRKPQNRGWQQQDKCGWESDESWTDC